MRYFLSLGSNLGEREQTLRAALQQIEQQLGPILRCSSFYYSEPWGFDSPNTFCNLCCCVETPLQPLEVLRLTQSVERALGRKKKSTDGFYSDRTIDIDIVRAFDDNGQEIHVSHPDLQIPHPLWQERDFVTVPLAEIS
jgi:2-amino-4-hydroxy-6-hydroxymethyldihydropteridine diphosphokinase